MVLPVGVGLPPVEFGEREAGGELAGDGGAGGGAEDVVGGGGEVEAGFGEAVEQAGLPGDAGESAAAEYKSAHGGVPSCRPFRSAFWSNGRQEVDNYSPKAV